MEHARRSYATCVSRGFTLIELLVVISIIAVLAAMLLPAIGLVKQAAKGINCGGNQRQVFLAISMYVSDNDGNLPRGYWGATNGQYISWDDLLSDYDGRETDLTALLAKSLTIAPGNDTTLYTCPAETFRTAGTSRKRSYAFTDGFPRLVGSLTRGLYSPVTTFAAGASDWAPSLSAIRKSSSTILLAEIRYPWARLSGIDGVRVDNPWSQATGNTPNAIGQVFPDSTLLYHGDKPLHGTSWNYLFVDGHVERLTPTQTLNPGTAASGTADYMWVR